MTTPVIRPAREDDLDQLIHLCREHADYEAADYVDDGQAGRLAHALFASVPVLWGWVVEADGELVGFMTATRDYATWTARFFVHMDCLYLRPRYRRLGLGRKLIETLVAFARARDCALIQWQTPADNATGIAFYERLGAFSKDKKRYFLDCERFAKAERIDAVT